MNIAYVALGANLGDPSATIRAAFGALANLPESRVVSRSEFWMAEQSLLLRFSPAALC